MSSASSPKKSPAEYLHATAQHSTPSHADVQAGAGAALRQSSDGRLATLSLERASQGLEPHCRKPSPGPGCGSQASVAGRKGRQGQGARTLRWLARLLPHAMAASNAAAVRGGCGALQLTRAAWWSQWWSYPAQQDLASTRLASRATACVLVRARAVLCWAVCRLSHSLTILFSSPMSLVATAVPFSTKKMASPSSPDHHHDTHTRFECRRDSQAPWARPPP